MTGSKQTGFDTGSVLKHLSAGATWMFWTLESKECRNRRNNICVLKKALLSKEEAGRIQRAYAELESKRLIVRVSANTYLMNPKAILPDFEYCIDVWEHWSKERTKKGLEL